MIVTAALGALALGLALALLLGLTLLGGGAGLYLLAVIALPVGLFLFAQAAPGPRDPARSERQFWALLGLIPFALGLGLAVFRPVTDWHDLRSGRVALLDQVLTGAETDAQLLTLPGLSPRPDLAVIARTAREIRRHGYGTQTSERQVALVPLVPAGWAPGETVPALAVCPMPPLTGTGARAQVLDDCVANWPAPVAQALRVPLPPLSQGQSDGLALDAGAVALRPVTSFDSEAAAVLRRARLAIAADRAP